MPLPLFERFPLSDEPVSTSAGPQPTPYHVYDGHLLLVGGHADLDAVRELLAPESVAPIATDTGRTPMGIYVADETAASHGAHGELQFSFYVSHEQLPPIPDRPFNLSHQLLEEPRARQMCHGLWNDTPAVVAYNREILGLDARLCHYAFERDADRLRFSFEAPDGAPLARGDLREGTRPTWAATRALFATFGFAAALRAARTKEVAVRVVNPVGEALPHNADARTYTTSQRIATHLFDPTTESLDILTAPYDQLGFRPAFVQHMVGFAMVYMEPDRVE